MSRHDEGYQTEQDIRPATEGPLTEHDEDLSGGMVTLPVTIVQAVVTTLRSVRDGSTDANGDPDERAEDARETLDCLTDVLIYTDAPEFGR